MLTTEESLLFNCFELGEWQTNCYLLGWRPSREAWLIDPGYQPARIIRQLQSESWNLSRILLTHAHLDHIAGVGLVREAFPECEVLIHPLERSFLTDPELNLSAHFEPVVAPEATGELLDSSILMLGELSFEVIHTPGHSPGGVTLYQKENGFALVGDTLFYRSIGRSDFPTSNPDALLASIVDRILVLPDETRIYPGHGPSTTVGSERRENPFLATIKGSMKDPMEDPAKGSTPSRN